MSMCKFIGCKLVTAEKVTWEECCRRLNLQVQPPRMAPVEKVYYMEYPDGYKTYCPVEVFERAYIPVKKNADLKTDISISQMMVDEFIAYDEVVTIEPATTLVRCHLRNGFVITEASTCVDPANYSQNIGAEICRKKIEDQIWSYLGFLLASAKNGMNN